MVRPGTQRRAGVSWAQRHQVAALHGLPLLAKEALYTAGREPGTAYRKWFLIPKVSRDGPFLQAGGTNQGS